MQSPGNSAPRITEIQKPNYVWKRLQNLWTGDPNRAVYLAGKEQADGSVWDSVYIGSVEYEDNNGVCTEHKFRFYGDLADYANSELKEKGQTALVWAEGHVKQSVWEDSNGESHVDHSTTVKRKNLAVLSIKPYMVGPTATQTANPFEIENSTSEPAQVDDSPVFPSECIGDDDAPF